MDTDITRPDDAQTQLTMPPQVQGIIDELLPPDNPQARWVTVIVLVCLAIVSFCLLGPWASNPDTYANTLASLDQKRETVMSLIAGSTGTSAAITVLPGDVGTPIAEKLLDIGSAFAIVIAAIYLEKYLLTTLGFVAFGILVPVGFLLLALSVAAKNRPMIQEFAAALGIRLAVFGIAVFLVVPVSTFISDRIDETYQTSMHPDVVAEAVEEPVAEVTAQTEEGGGILEFIQSLPETVAKLPETVSESTSGVSEDVQNTLNKFIETLAVMIVSSCVIPIVVLLFFLWLAMTILGINIDTAQLRRGAEMLVTRRGLRI